MIIQMYIIIIVPAHADDCVILYNTKVIKGIHLTKEKISHHLQSECRKVRGHRTHKKEKTSLQVFLISVLFATVYFHPENM